MSSDPNNPKSIYYKPKCQVPGCNNVAHNAGRRKDGSIIYRKRKCPDTGNSFYVCGGCHQKYYREKTGADWSFGLRDGESRAYIKHRKDYCENRDGRLGYACTATIVHERQLTVDHVLENFSKTNKDLKEDKDKNEPHNLQTLCHNCHNYKSHLVATVDVKQLKKMMKVHFENIDKPFTKHKLTRDVNSMLRNAGKISVFFLVFSFTMLVGCSTLNKNDRVSAEVVNEQQHKGTPETQSEMKVRYKLWKF